MCLYHADVASQPGGQAGIITDVAIQNPTSTTMTFPSTSAVVIGVDEIMPGAEMAAGTNMTTSKKMEDNLLDNKSTLLFFLVSFFYKNQFSL